MIKTLLEKLGIFIYNDEVIKGFEEGDVLYSEKCGINIFTLEYKGDNEFSLTVVVEDTNHDNLDIAFYMMKSKVVLTEAQAERNANAIEFAVTLLQ